MGRISRSVSGYIMVQTGGNTPVLDENRDTLEVLNRPKKEHIKKRGYRNPSKESVYTSSHKQI